MSLWPYGIQGNPGYPLGLSAALEQLIGEATQFCQVVLDGSVGDVAIAQWAGAVALDAVSGLVELFNQFNMVELDP